MGPVFLQGTKDTSIKRDNDHHHKKNRRVEEFRREARYSEKGTPCQISREVLQSWYFWHGVDQPNHDEDEG